MQIHNLQTQFRLLVAIVYKRDFNNNLICAQIAHLHKVNERSDQYVFRYVDALYTLCNFTSNCLQQPFWREPIKR